MRGDFTRGIIASMYTEIDEHIGAGALMDLYRNTYDESPFVHLSEDNISLKEVVNTNKAILHLERHGKYIHITSIIDNLLKGASGQAVQNMNIMFGLPQERALKLKGIAF
jgi:N-acetyl-gamma-glutamyl-phosphate reductase